MASSASSSSRIGNSRAGAGMTPSTYIGNDGLYGRSDLTGLNLAQYPSILVETGNMKNAHDAALMAQVCTRTLHVDAMEVAA